MSGRDSVLSQNVIDINSFNVPLANEFLCSSILSNYNLYEIVYNMFITVGIPIQKSVVSDNDLWISCKHSGSLDLLKLRESSNTINNFVFENVNLQYITNNDDINKGLKLWNSIELTMIDFLNSMNFLIKQVDKELLDMDIQQDSIVSADPFIMMYLYSKNVNLTIELISNSTVFYKEAFILLEKYNTEFKLNNKQVSNYFSFVLYFYMNNNIIPT